MYEKDKYELMAEKIGEAAFAETIGVARKFARMVGMVYERHVTAWNIHSEFKTCWWASGHFYNTKRSSFLTSVSLSIRMLECSEAVELAWELERTWNERAELLNVADKAIDRLFDQGEDYYAELVEDEMDEFIDKTPDVLAEIVERWLDSVECWYWSGEYADELRKENKEVM